MKVFGVINLVVSIDIDDCDDALLAANYKLNDINTEINVLHIKDLSGNLHRLNVHSLEINWEEVFDD